MNTYQAILSALSQGTISKKIRLKDLACLIIGVLRCRSVNLYKLAALQNSDASEDSQYHKLQRFFLRWLFPWIDIAKITLNKIPKSNGGYILSTDRPNWKLGNTHINILTVEIVVGKVTIPFIWISLPQSTKRGKSHSKHLILIMNRFFKVLAPEDTSSLTIDREFNGKDG